MSKVLFAFRKMTVEHSKKTLVTLFTGAGILAVMVFVCSFPFLLTHSDPLDITPSFLKPPDDINKFGTDMLGRDILTRCLYGGRSSFSIALYALSISFGVGVPLGFILGYIGGKTDRFVVMIMDSFYAFPEYISALAFSIALGASIPSISIAVGLAYIPRYFRMVRSITLSIKEKPFIEAERTIGVGTLSMVAKYIFPYAISSITVVMSMGVASSILIVSGLGFIGLGIQPPTPEWGTDLRYGRDVFLRGEWWVSFFPALMIFLSVLGFNLISEGLDSFFKEQEGGRYAA